jgi:single-strand DNA-binding protein
MKGINKVILVGVIGKDPEIRYTPNGNQIANISVATNVKFKDKRTGEDRQKTSWHQCTAFGKVAELIGTYCEKGKKIYIEGSLDYQDYEKDGIKRYITKITIKDFILLSSSNTEQGQGQPQSQEVDRTAFEYSMPENDAPPF